MSYRINKTNGDLLVDLVDGQINTTSTNLTLVGRNYAGFGESINENFVKLLENFSGTVAPGTPITGQLWFDTTGQRLQVYNGTSFKSAGGPIVSTTQPTMVSGDLWIDSLNNQLHFYDGTDLVLVGPEYQAGQQKTGFETQSVVDSVNVTKTALKLFIAGVLVGVFADSQYYVELVNGIPGYPQDTNDTQTPKRQLYKKGFNPVSSLDFKYWGTADSATSLINAAGTKFTTASFMSAVGETQTTGKVSIKNPAGLAIGVGDIEYGVLKVNSGTNQIELEAQQANTDINLKIREGNAYISGIFVDATNKRVGIINDTPTVELDVTGAGKFSSHLTVGGNLLVSGDTTYLNTSTLRVEDKNIELGIQDDSTVGADAVIDGGGIILKSSDGDKELSWVNATDSWTFNQDLNLTTSSLNADPAYKIDGTIVLSKTELASTVTTATGLVNIGTLGALDIDNLNFNGSTITATGGGLNITTAGDIAVNTQKIIGVADPTAAQGVATKNYVDTQIDSDNVGINLDITGFSNPNAGGVSNGPINDVIAVLNTLYPAATKNGAQARVHCTNYAGASIVISQALLAGALNKSYVAVDKDNVSSTQSVMSDLAVAAAGVSGSATITPTRYTMIFTSNGSAWSHASTSSYP
jgi:hypothetical protein